MTTMDPAHCRQALARLLADENALLRELSTQLEDEHGFLAANDIDGLEAAGTRRQATVSRLLHIEDERRSLCRMFDRPADLSGVESLLEWCDPAASLLPAFEECQALATRCRENNDRNGALVSARLQHVSGMLGMLGGAAAGSPTYGPRSAAGYASPNLGRVLTTRA